MGCVCACHTRVGSNIGPSLSLCRGWYGWVGSGVGDTVGEVGGWKFETLNS